MKIVYLAAGQGSRLRPITNDRPKAMVPFFGKPMVSYNIETALKCGIDKMVIVVGHHPETIDFPGMIKVFNPDFAVTNMCHSLFCAIDHLDDDIIVSYTDIVYNVRILRALLADVAPCSIAVDLDWRSLWAARMPDPLSDAETLKMSSDGFVTELGEKPNSYEDIQGQYIGLLRFSREKILELFAFYLNQSDKNTVSFTELLRRWISSGVHIKAVPVNGGWIEIDTLEDLEVYQNGTRWFDEVTS